MKKILLITAFGLMIMGFAKAQAPQMMNYQAVVRDVSGNIQPNQTVSFRLGILQGSTSGINVFSETHSASTNAFGLVNLPIGGGTLVSGNFSGINWTTGPYFVQIELDDTGGSSYSLMGTSQLLSVPYALYAENSGSAANDSDQDSTNELQALSQAGNTVTLSNGGGNISVADADADPNNEIQALSISNDTLFLSNGGFVVLPAGQPDTDDQTLSISNDTLYIADGNSVDLSSYANTDSQTLSLTGDTLAISNGNDVVLYDHPIEMTGATPVDRQIKFVGDPADSTDAVNAQTLQWSSLVYAEATGNTDTFMVAVSPAVTILRPGTTIMFKANHAISGASCLNLNGLGPIAIKKNVTADLAAGEILNGQMVQVVYDGNVFQVGAGSLSSGGASDEPCYTCDGF